MKTAVEELKAKVRAVISARYPQLVIRFTTVMDDSSDVGVVVYGVETALTIAVESLILELDWTLCANSGLALTPLVINLEDTLRSYPQFAPIPLKVADDEAVPTPGSDYRFETIWRSDAPSQMACNEELALAA